MDVRQLEYMYIKDTYFDRHETQTSTNLMITHSAVAARCSKQKKKNTKVTT